MVPLTLGLPKRRRARILCLGAHSDDIEIGCGGTILQILADRPNTHVDWVVFSGDGIRQREALRSAKRFLQTAKGSTVTVREFRDGFFPTEWVEIKEYFEDMKRTMEPDLIFTHYRSDRHQDHRVIAELTWNTFRNHLILEYEVPKYEGDLHTPNVYVPVADSHRRKKVQYLFDSFASQKAKRWFTESTFTGLMRIRGIESACEQGYAEGFHGPKVTLQA